MLLATIKNLLKRFLAFVTEAPNSVKNYLNIDELVRVVLTAFWAGGGVFGVLTAVMASVGTIFPSPTDAGLAAAILTAAIEAYRRLSHGRAPAPKQGFGRN